MRGRMVDVGTRGEARGVDSWEFRRACWIEAASVSASTSIHSPASPLGAGGSSDSCCRAYGGVFRRADAGEFVGRPCIFIFGNGGNRRAGTVAGSEMDGAMRLPCTHLL